MMRNSLVWMTILGLVVGGCSRGPERGTVNGQVTLDGQPLPDAFVVLHSEEKDSVAARGVTDADGRFKLRGDDGGDGAVIGDYRVVVLDAKSLVSIVGKEEDDSGTPPPCRKPRSAGLHPNEDNPDPGADPLGRAATQRSVVVQGGVTVGLRIDAVHWDDSTVPTPTTSDSGLRGGVRTNRARALPDSRFSIAQRLVGPAVR